MRIKIVSILIIFLCLIQPLYSAGLIIDGKKQSISIEDFSYDGVNLVIKSKSTIPLPVPTESPTLPGGGNSSESCQSGGLIVCSYDLFLNQNPVGNPYTPHFTNANVGKWQDYIVLQAGKTLVSRLPVPSQTKQPAYTVTYQSLNTSGHPNVELWISQTPGGSALCKTKPSSFVFSIGFTFNTELAYLYGDCVLSPGGAYFLNMRLVGDIPPGSYPFSRGVK